MKFFAIVHNPAGDYAISYEGMSQAAVTESLGMTGFLYDLVTQDVYETFVASHAQTV